MERILYRSTIKHSYSRSYLVGKRILDIVGSLLLIVCCVPVFILSYLILFVASGRPVLFSQTRTGKNGVPFIIWKFRTMNQDINHRNEHIYQWTKGVPDDFIFKSPDDKKVTRIGKVFRKYSVDELPQLFNVLVGDMSLVGPRPEIPEITQHYNQQQSKRLLVKPGLTGYAQINGRSEISHGKKMELDQYYVDHCSFMMDLKIIIRTTLQVISGKGAF